MGSQFSSSAKNAYGVTYATLDESGLHFETELAIQLLDGPLVTLKMPTHLSERQALSQLICGADAGVGWVEPSAKPNNPQRFGSQNDSFSAPLGFAALNPTYVLRQIVGNGVRL